MTRKFTPATRKMTPAEKERAALVSPKEYPQDLPCAICRFRWMQHQGTLCPIRPGYFDHVLGLPVPPLMGNTTFIPDVAYLNQNPDFDVV
jgi:hypothetical protein